MIVLDYLITRMKQKAPQIVNDQLENRNVTHGSNMVEK